MARRGPAWMPVALVCALLSASPASADQVVADDLIVDRLCAGVPCAEGEAFADETLRLKALHPIMRFHDTETAGGEPSTDWALAANDGDRDRFMLKNLGAGTTPFLVDGDGDVGIGRLDPILDLHIETGNTPGVRLDQNAGGGFTHQIWDIAGNEANFFVRDTTAGSRLPFRIRPGAPTSSIDIAASGNVGVGTASPEAPLEIERNGTPQLRFDNSATGAQDWEAGLSGTRDMRLKPVEGQSTGLTLAPEGDVAAAGTLEQAADGFEASEAMDATQTLERIRALPVTTWELAADPDNARHAGPTGQAFRDVFGLGTSANRVAPGDLAGVGLVGIKALDARVTALGSELDTLESGLGALTTRADGTDSGLGALTTRVKALEDGTGPTATSLTAVNERLAALEQGKTGSDKRVKALQKANKKLTARLRAIEKKLRER